MICLTAMNRKVIFSKNAQEPAGKKLTLFAIGADIEGVGL